MQTAAKINLVPTDLTSFRQFADSQKEISYGGFYKQLTSDLVKGVFRTYVLRDLGERLVVLAEYARASRQMDVLDRVSQILTNSLVPRQYETIGRYYQALCIHKFGRGDVERAAQLLERVAENAPSSYRVRALVSLGSNAVHKGDYQSALSFYRNACYFASSQAIWDPISVLGSQKDVAVINSMQGNHRGALAMLESLFSLATSMRSSQPHVYYDYLNSLAVELCEVGRLEEAKNVSQIAVASPFAHAYPEWRETRNEIELKGHRASRATVAVNRTTFDVGNLLCLPVPDRQYDASRQEHIPGQTKQQARVFDLVEWKKRMGERLNETPRDKTPYREMDGREMLLRIMELTGSQDRTDEELERILEAIDRVLSESKGTSKR